MSGYQQTQNFTPWALDNRSGRYYRKNLITGKYEWNDQSTPSSDTGGPSLSRSITSPAGYAASYPNPYTQVPQAVGGAQMQVGEGLDPSYMMRTDSRTFFVRGRMFSTLHVEAFGGTAAEAVDSDSVFAVKYGERVFCQIRRFVVVKDDKGFCLACPIATYRGRGTTKPGVNPAHHAVIYTSNSGPSWLPGETGMSYDPIAVDPAEYNMRLNPASRINFAQVHCIQQNVKVKDMGVVRLDDLPKLIAYWKAQMQ